MKQRRTVGLIFLLLVLLVTSVFAGLPWGTRYEACHDDCDPASGEGTCVLSRKFEPWGILVIHYLDLDESGSFHPAADEIRGSEFTPTPHRVACSDVGRIP